MTEEITVTVDGMTCASCVGRVERSLKALPDVGAVAVNLATGRARVEFGGRADSGAVVRALAKAGYPAREEIVQLEIEGMTCASCVGRVERALKAQPGVLEAAVNLATNGARVRFAEGATTASELATAVGKVGYGAHVRRDSEGPAAVDRHVAKEAMLLRRFTAPSWMRCTSFRRHEWPKWPNSWRTRFARSTSPSQMKWPLFASTSA